MRKFMLLLAAIGSVAATALVFAEPAVTVKDVSLRQTPASDAKTLATVPSGTRVNLVKREGAWVELQAGKSTGWTKFFDIRLPVATGGRSGSAQTPGLDAATLGKATPNAQEFNLLLTFTSSKPQAQAFAKAGKLDARKLERNQ